MSRASRVLADGRVHHSMLVSHPDARTTYPWECVCAAGEHDHDASHAKITERLVARDKHLDGLWALVGQTGRVGLIRYTITDCNIQIHGPANWRLYVAWDQQALGQDEPLHREHSIDYEHPKHCLSPAEIVDRVEGWARVAGNDYVKALRAAGDFVSGK